MTPRSFFTILIKIMGLYLVLASITVVPELFSTLMMFKSTDGKADLGFIAVAIMFLLLAGGLFYITLRLCVFKTDWLIDKLELDKHFQEEKFELNIHRSTVLSIAIIVIGALMFIDALPMMCREAYNYAVERPFLASVNTNSTTIGWFIFYGAKALIGYLLMTNSNAVINWIEYQRK